MQKEEIQNIPEIYCITVVKDSPKPDIAFIHSTFGHLMPDGVGCCFLTGKLDPEEIFVDLMKVTKSNGERPNVAYLILDPSIKAGLFQYENCVILAVLNYWIKKPQETIDYLRSLLPNPSDNYDVIIIEENGFKNTRMKESLINFFNQNDIVVLVTP